MDVFTNGLDLDQIITQVRGRERRWGFPGPAPEGDSEGRVGVCEIRSVHVASRARQSYLRSSNDKHRQSRRPIFALSTPRVFWSSLRRGCNFAASRGQRIRTCRRRLSAYRISKIVSGHFSFNGEVTGEGKAEAWPAPSRAPWNSRLRTAASIDMGFWQKSSRSSVPWEFLRFPTCRRKDFRTTS